MHTGFAILGVFFLDRGSKAWMKARLLAQSDFSLPVFPFFRLTYVENMGGSFGILPRSNLFFILSSLLLIAWLCWWRRHFKGGILREWGWALVLGGALGNLYDRIAFGYVIDFLDFIIWPVFNLADSCISVGVGFLLLSFWREKIHAPRSL